MFQKSRKAGIHVLLSGTLLLSYAPAIQAESDSAETSVHEDKPVLAKLEIEGVKFSKEFAADTAAYTATVGNETESIQLLAASETEGAHVTVNGKEAGKQAESYTLKTGSNIFTIIVSDEDNQSSVYTVTVTREENGDPSLKGIELSNGNITFDPSVKNYQIAVDQEAAALTVHPITNQDVTNITVNGKMDSGNGVTVPIKAGQTKIDIVSTAENGKKAFYTLTVTRKPTEAKTDSGGGGEEAQKESPAAEKVKDPEKKQEEKAKAKKENVSKKEKAEPVMTDVKEKEKDAVAGPNAGRQSDKSVSAGKGEAAIQKNGIQLASQPTQQTKGQTEKQAPMLESLTVSAGSWNKKFQSAEHTYHITVDKDTSSVTIHADASEAGTDITYNKKESRSVKLEDRAKNTVAVTVSSDNARRTYVLVFEKDIEVLMDEEEEVKTVFPKGDESDVKAVSETRPDQGTEESASVWRKIADFFQSLL
ncbi:cadherin-like beta sandwich domain-containing protein [Bacillus massiliglaciei]|uniref:cadherin-like beta sandwich domain-containing protein n=1 Tax=Bacillus massiliglaciei TaxID=1816693 RepID=UPI0018FED4FA|nr:cadherin-like beta sandwich domain-containing protein [Bacillus massiliglaciei]